MTPPGLAFRPLAAADLDAVFALAAGLAHAPHWSRAVWTGLLAPGAFPARLGLGAFLSGRLAGFAVTRLTPPEAELESIAVAVPFQRQGIARALYAVTEAQLRSARVDTILLEVRVSNAPAQALYRALGFAPAGRRTGYYADPPEDALVLRCEIA